MPAHDPEMRRQAARAGAATRWRKPHASEARRDLAEQRLAAYIERTIAAAPPLSDAQLDRLAVLLRSGGDGA